MSKKRPAQRIVEIGQEVAAIAVALGCDKVFDGKPCKRCIARALGLVAGAGVLHADALPEFLKVYQEFYNASAEKFDLTPVSIRAIPVGDYNPEAN